MRKRELAQQDYYLGCTAKPDKAAAYSQDKKSQSLSKKKIAFNKKPTNTEEEDEEEKEEDVAVSKSKKRKGASSYFV